MSNVNSYSGDVIVKSLFITYKEQHGLKLDVMHNIMKCERKHSHATRLGLLSVVMNSSPFLPSLSWMMGS